MEIGTHIEKFLTFSSVGKANGEPVMYIQELRSYLGMLGNFYIAERLFDVYSNIQFMNSSSSGEKFDKSMIAMPYKNYITLEDFLVYNDVVSNGNVEQKNWISF